MTQPLFGRGHRDVSGRLASHISYSKQNLKKVNQQAQQKEKFLKTTWTLKNLLLEM